MIVIETSLMNLNQVGDRDYLQGKIRMCILITIALGTKFAGWEIFARTSRVIFSIWSHLKHYRPLFLRTPGIPSRELQIWCESRFGISISAGISIRKRRPSENWWTCVLLRTRRESYPFRGMLIEEIREWIFISIVCGAIWETYSSTKFIQFIGVWLCTTFLWWITMSNLLRCRGVNMQGKKVNTEET